MPTRAPSNHVNLIDDRVLNAPEKTRSIYWDDDATLVEESPTEDRFLPPIPFSPRIPGHGSDRSSLVIPPLTEFGTPITSAPKLPRSPFNSASVAAPRSPVVASRATPQSSQGFPIPPRVRASSTFGHTHGGSSGGRPPAMPPTPRPVHHSRPCERSTTVSPIIPTDVRPEMNRPNGTDPARGPRQRSISLAPAYVQHFRSGLAEVSLSPGDEISYHRRNERAQAQAEGGA
ncbi:hypothetical protein NLJ89_g573 [Agrocybe chaxingu]|uniref:Uncharacterized protein n=1 Tax=Agrocybe chaxingu TaxID=84603 RepID=A0A9W8N1N8_9AGAR|nr:hypothetical protein NLJ89_g573 [Agrocybe chaxingu]